MRRCECDNFKLIRSADYIFGLFSIILVWSALLGRVTLSYQPHAKKGALLVTAKQGVAPMCTNPDALYDMVNALLTDPAFTERWRARLAAWNPPVDGVEKAVGLLHRLAA